MDISGVNVPVIDVTVTLPKTRKDGSPLAPADIASVVILRNSVEWKTLVAPFSSPIVATDSSPVSSEDAYSFYTVDTAGARSDVSPAVVMTVSKDPIKAPPATGTLTAIAKGAKVEPVLTAKTTV